MSFNTVNRMNWASLASSASRAALKPPSFRGYATGRPQNRLTAAYYRGGSSRAVFMQKKDLPADETQWADIFRGVIGSPDPYGRQLDGMGGGVSSLSKVCIVGPPTHPDADVDYTFVSIGIKDAKVDYSSNCGNMSASVGPFAIDSRLHLLPSDSSDEVTVRIYNTNTKKLIHAKFGVVEGEAASSGDLAIDGVAGNAAPITLDFIDPAGSRTGKLLPTGQVLDTIKGFQVSCVDAGNPCCFVLASELKVPGNLKSDEIEAKAELKKTLEAIRREAAVKMGLAQTEDDVPGSVPKISIVSPSQEQSANDVTVRAMSVGQAHKAIPVTVAIATAAAAKLRGSTVASCFPDGSAGDGGLNVWHASGKLKVDSKFNEEGDLLSGSVFRTSRRLMEGTIFWR